MNSQEELLPAGDRGSGRWEAEGGSVTGNRGQALISFMPDFDGADSDFLLDSILSILLKKSDPVMSG